MWKKMFVTCFLFVMLHQGEARFHAAKGRGDKTPWLANTLSKNE
jgi:hypothetical protein